MMTLDELILFNKFLYANLSNELGGLDKDAFHEAWCKTVRDTGSVLSTKKHNGDIRF